MAFIPLYVRRRGKISGPFDQEALMKMAFHGSLARFDEVSADKVFWRPAGTDSRLFYADSPATAQLSSEPRIASGIDNCYALTPEEPEPSPQTVNDSLVNENHQDLSHKQLAVPGREAAIRLSAIGSKPIGQQLNHQVDSTVCGACATPFGNHIPFNFYEQFVICKRCRNSLINRRAGAYILDILFIYIGIFFFGAVLLMMAGAGGADQAHIDKTAVDGIGCFVWIAVLIYLLVKDGLFQGRSLGKAACGIRVVRTQDGAPCRIGASVLRNLPLMIPLVPLIAAIQINGGDSSRFGDGWAETAVVGKSWPQLASTRKW